MKLVNSLLFANVKCYWPRSKTRKSLLFANVKCYWPRSETRESVLFANVKYYWPRSETRNANVKLARVCYLQMSNVMPRSKTRKEFVVCKCEMLLATE